MIIIMTSHNFFGMSLKMKLLLKKKGTNCEQNGIILGETLERKIGDLLSSIGSGLSATLMFAVGLLCNKSVLIS